jgi:HEAT repeat protein
VTPESQQTPGATPPEKAQETPPAVSAEKAWKMLKAGTTDEKKGKRDIAVRALGLMPGDPRSVKAAETALSDKEAEVRAAAAGALGQMGAKNSKAKLRRALKDKDSEVVFAAAHSLKDLGDDSAYQVYYAVLTGRMKSGRGLLKQQEEELKDPKKIALFGFEQGIGFVPFGGLGYRAFRTLAKDDSSPVRAAAAKVLAQDPDPHTGEALVEAATSDKSWVVRTAALDAIAHRGDASLLPKIAPALADERDEVRFTAAATVLRLSRAGKRNQASPRTARRPVRR